MNLNNLGTFLSEKGDVEGGESLYRRSLAINEKVLGPEHESTATAQQNMGGILSEKGNYVEAESFYRRNVEIREKIIVKTIGFYLE